MVGIYTVLRFTAEKLFSSNRPEANLNEPKEFFCVAPSLENNLERVEYLKEFYDEPVAESPVACSPRNAGNTQINVLHCIRIFTAALPIGKPPVPLRQLTSS